ncbi:uncharacterized protein LOC132624442 [Lycium barbarum]|uniref:uncharacterized protein LOC132624442 n=1 Tax=Lycium barbarum TaxID=112863 RepID=UPI00293E645E|nr:uncharacterized protein LOC132624442 [Lycium barbarum]
MAYIRLTDCLLFLFNPLSGKKIHLPSVETLSHYCKGVIRNSESGLIEYFITCLGERYTPPVFAEAVVRWVVLSSSPMDDDCIAVICYGHNSKLGFCRIRGDNSWVELGSPYNSLYRPIVFHNGKKLFFTVSYYSNEIDAWDLHNNPIKRFHLKGQDGGVLSTWYQPLEEEPDAYYEDEVEDEDEDEDEEYARPSTNYLVYDHQSQELFIVLRRYSNKLDREGKPAVPAVYRGDSTGFSTTFKTEFFDVLKVDFIKDDRAELQYLEAGIGNRAFFIGKNPGLFSPLNHRIPELRPNFIYFTDDLSYIEEYWGGHDFGIYDHGESSIYSCYYPHKIQKIWPAPIWFLPDVGADL